MAGMADAAARIALTEAELRAVTSFAAACARPALAIFHRHRPADRRPQEALEAAEAFVQGAPRSKRLRDAAWSAQRAAHDARQAGHLAASEAARAALAAAGAAFLHPLAKATQVKHILGSAGHAALAFEFDHGGDPSQASGRLAELSRHATPQVRQVLRRYPPAPAGHGRVGALIRQLDALLR
jgi:hypothetical protein